MFWKLKSELVPIRNFFTEKPRIDAGGSVGKKIVPPASAGIF